MLFILLEKKFEFDCYDWRYDLLLPFLSLYTINPNPI